MGVGVPSSPLSSPQRLAAPLAVEAEGGPSLPGKTVPVGKGSFAPRRAPRETGLEPAGLSASCPSRGSPLSWEAMATAALAIGGY